MAIWDDPELEAGDYIKLANPGDEAQGRIEKMEVGLWFDDAKHKSVRIWLLCADGETRHVTASYVKLAEKLRELRPEVGDDLYIKYLSRDKHPNDPKKNIAKWDVRVKKGSPWDEPVATKVHHVTAATNDPIAAHPQGAALRAAGVPDETIKATLGL